MSIEEEFKLKPIKKASYFGIGRQALTKYKEQKTQKVKRNTYLERVKARKERAEAFEKRREDVLLWTLREVQEYFDKHDAKMSVRMSNIVSSIVAKKYETK